MGLIDAIGNGTYASDDDPTGPAPGRILTLAEAADALRISTATADRRWAYARAWLVSAIRDED